MLIKRSFRYRDGRTIEAEETWNRDILSVSNLVELSSGGLFEWFFYDAGPRPIDYVLFYSEVRPGFIASSQIEYLRVKDTEECKCGSKNATGQGHSFWCGRFKCEF